MDSPRLVGILGGMGPAATLDLQHKILSATSASTDQDHVPTIVWNIPQLPDRLAAIFNGGPSPLPHLVQAGQFMQQAGATAIAMPCNTAHFWAADLQAALDVPLLHIADAVLDSLPVHVRRIGLLSTPATVTAGFYQDRFRSRGIETLLPTEDESRELMSAIRAVKAGQTGKGQAPFLRVSQAVLGRGADTLLLACTELPLLSPGTAIEAQCVDPTAALARACIQHAFSLHPTGKEQSRGVELA